jgi:hypothetical protein
MEDELVNDFRQRVLSGDFSSSDLRSAIRSLKVNE